MPVIIEQAIYAIISHHDAIRLSFYKSGDKWHAKNMPLNDESAFEVIDLSDTYSKANAEKFIQSKILNLQNRISLSKGHLLKAALFISGAEQNFLIITIHHLAVDGVSWRILMEDFNTALMQMTKEEHIKLPYKTSSFRQWAIRLKKYADSSELLQEKEFWTKKRGNTIPTKHRSFNMPDIKMTAEIIRKRKDLVVYSGNRYGQQKKNYQSTYGTRLDQNSPNINQSRNSIDSPFWEN